MGKLHFHPPSLPFFFFVADTTAHCLQQLSSSLRLAVFYYLVMIILLFQLQKTAFDYSLSDVNIKKCNSSFILLTLQNPIMQ